MSDVALSDNDAPIDTRATAEELELEIRRRNERNLLRYYRLSGLDGLMRQMQVAVQTRPQCRVPK